MGSWVFWVLGWGDGILLAFILSLEKALSFSQPLTSSELRMSRARVEMHEIGQWSWDCIWVVYLLMRSWGGPRKSAKSDKSQLWKVHYTSHWVHPRHIQIHLFLSLVLLTMVHAWGSDLSGFKWSKWQDCSFILQRSFQKQTVFSRTDLFQTTRVLCVFVVFCYFISFPVPNLNNPLLPLGQFVILNFLKTCQKWMSFWNCWRLAVPVMRPPILCLLPSLTFLALLLCSLVDAADFLCLPLSFPGLFPEHISSFLPFCLVLRTWLLS